MSNKYITNLPISMILVVLILVSGGCASNKTQDLAAASVETYLEALIAKDVNTMINQSCGSWEEDARLEYQSFAAVEVSLEDLDCQTGRQQAGFTLVSCTGRIVANYGAEDLIIELSERQYKVAEEGGEWRVCGYE